MRVCAASPLCARDCAQFQPHRQATQAIKGMFLRFVNGFTFFKTTASASIIIIIFYIFSLLQELISSFLSLMFLKIALSSNISKSFSEYRRKKQTLLISMDDPQPLWLLWLIFNNQTRSPKALQVNSPLACLGEAEFAIDPWPLKCPYHQNDYFPI